jgi:NADPH:quinone reductase
MRALVMEGFGAPSAARPGEMPKPDIGPADLLVRIGAATLNPVDWKEMAGFMQSFYPPYPPRWIPGFDGAGVVEAVGSEVAQFSAGDHVLVRPDRSTGHGTLAEYACVPQDRAAKVPAGLDPAQTACIATAGRTAYQALFRSDVCALQAGQTVLIEGAAGGVGSYAVAFARAAGIKTVATCRDTNMEYVRGLGADIAIDYRHCDVVAEVRRQLPLGVDVVLDCHSGGHKSELLDVLAPGGILVVVATLTQDADLAKLAAVAQKRGLVVRVMLMDYTTLQADMVAIADFMTGRRVALPELSRYPLERAAEALEAVRVGGVRGKVVVELGRQV